MIANVKAVKYLWVLSLVLVTSLILGSFFVSSNYLDLIYLIILYSFLFIKIRYYNSET